METRIKMKNKFYLGIFFLLTSHIIQAGNFVVIGDSLSGYRKFGEIYL